MKNVLFITNIPCRHQIGIWDPLSKMEDIDFKYLCTRHDTIINLRYKIGGTRDYLVNSWELNNHDLINLISSASIIFYGSICDSRIPPLLHNNGKCFLISEHLSKTDFHEIKKLRGFRNYIHYIIQAKYYSKGINTNYVFCASSHTGEDFRRAGVKKKSLLKFGYYPILPYAFNHISTPNKTNNILWIGREMHWKHPEIAIYALKVINSFGRKYNLNIIGISNTFLEQTTKSSIDYSLVSCLGALPYNKVSHFFLESEIYIFSSDRREGFGCVLVEAMSAGCVVFANAEAGSTRYIVEDGINGFTYKNKYELKRKIKKYMRMSLENKENIRKKAIETATINWDGKLAAKRLHTFICDCINGKTFVPFKNGPLSLDR